MNIKKHIPNAITCCNLLSGVIATMMAYQGRYEYTLLFVLLSATFDFFDGFVARLLKVSGPMGKELDSLADVISFGLVPGMLAFSLVQPLGVYWKFIPYFSFLMTAFAALRLAKFNIDSRQTTSFIGLATPANAIFWCGIAYGFGDVMNVRYGVIVMVMMSVSCYLQVCELPMFSLKLHSLKWKDSYKQWILVIGALVLLAIFRLKALALVVVWYVALAVFFWVYEKVSK